jgi:NAD(P)-dependent dehydrogenase (short-subunit alcohol dehydrogenase family)
MRVNAKSVFLGCKYALTQMLAQVPHSSGDRGWIINISSIMGIIGGPENRELVGLCPVDTDLTGYSFLLCIERGC